MFKLLKTLLESVILVSDMSTVWEDTDACANQYMYALDVDLMTVLSYSYGVIMDCVINEPGHVNNVADGLNATDKHHLKENMEILGKLGTNDTTKIGMLPNASKDVSINFPDQYLQIINNK